MVVPIVITVVLLVSFPALGAWVGGDKGDDLADRLPAALAGLYLGVWASFWVWVIYVVIHFLAKIW